MLCDFTDSFVYTVFNGGKYGIQWKNFKCRL